MRHAPRYLWITLVVPGLLGSPARASLDHERRVDAHRAVERVLWERRIWPDSNPQPKPPLEEVLSERALRERVDDVLRKSNALEALWKRPIGSRELQAEIDRMARGSRDAETWSSMLDALGRDPELVGEAIARPALVDRLIRSWYASDARYHETERKEAERAFSGVVSAADLARVAPRYEKVTWTRDRRETAGKPSLDAIAVDDREWSDLVLDLRARFPRSRDVVELGDTAVEAALADLPVGRVSPIRETDDAYSVTVVLSKAERNLEVATASWPKTRFDAWWSAERPRHVPILTRRAADDLPIVLPESVSSPPHCADNTWTPTEIGAPTSRFLHTLVWTGSEMIVWGGWSMASTNTGARYNPATDTWTPMSTHIAPIPRGEHVAVWTGTRMVVWGGRDLPTNTFYGDGGRYDPVTDTWTQTTTVGAPSARITRAAVWTGSRMVVLGDAFASQGSMTGGRYDPVADSWSATTTVDAPLETLGGSPAVWTGSLVVLWPGSRYDPVADAWTPIATAGAPAVREAHTLVWTGSRAIVWGGVINSVVLTNTGGSYDPASNTWTAMTTAGAPDARAAHAAVWVAGRLVVWGGERDFTYISTGGRYDPATDTWAPMTTTGVPIARVSPPAVATSTEMIVWGGFINANITNTGGRYDPVSDSWVPTNDSGPAPAPRLVHSTVWTGAEMIVWGGADLMYRNDGSAYSPATDSWLFTSDFGAPSARGDAGAVWTGTEMILWGGVGYGEPGLTFLGDGAAYDPTSRIWRPISSTGAPVGRRYHGIVWTGTSVIVWGGAADGVGPMSTGGRYDPVANAWTPTSTVGAPQARVLPSAVWTGSRMVVWGGAGAGPDPLETLQSGGRYDPVTDSWAPTTLGGAPRKRYGHATVWTGTHMLVWGGWDVEEFHEELASGASYDPSSDQWMALPEAGGPSARAFPGAVWSGNEMILWGGLVGNSAVGTGGRYRPADGSWRTVTPSGAPRARSHHSAIWTGAAMIVWGGRGEDGYFGFFQDGGRYCSCVPWYFDADGDGYGDPYTNVSTCDGSQPAGMSALGGDCNDANVAIHPGVPDASCNGVDEDCDGPQDEDYLPQPSVCGLGVCRAFGSLECVSGQVVNTCVPGTPNAPIDESCNTLDDDCDGGVDDDFPQRDDYWTATATAPSARTNHTAVWSGTEMITFGGDNGSGSVQTGGNAYAPASNAWRTLATGPAKRWHHTAVWTGTRMVVWGGDDNTATIYNSGSRYDPATDTWATTTTTSAPTARGLHTAVWTGSRMVIWGGRDVVSYFNTGSRYDPVANTWSSTTTTGAPAGRANHTAVWTGTEMIVWGGQTTGGAAVNTGSRYNPTTNTWAATTTTGAPSARYGHVALWTGTEMIVWGGTTDGITYLSGGARYNPATNTWTPVNALVAPTRRAFASSVWTGEEMVVWGGTYRTNEEPDTPLADGARYNPAGDSWSLPMNVHLVLPAARARAAAVWTGSEMIVWGGDPNGSSMSSGGRYNPRTLCGTGGCQQVGVTYCAAGAIGFQCAPLPATSEVCDGVDNDCDVLIDEGIPVPTARPAVLATKLSSGGDAFYAWIDTADTTGYDVVRGGLGTLHSSAGNFTLAVDACIANDVRATSFQALGAPVAGGHWYLVRPVNLCSGNGSYDEGIPPQQGSRDGEIAAAAGACP